MHSNAANTADVNRVATASRRENCFESSRYRSNGDEFAPILWPRCQSQRRLLLALRPESVVRRRQPIPTSVLLTRPFEPEKWGDGHMRASVKFRDGSEWRS